MFHQSSSTRFRSIFLPGVLLASAYLLQSAPVALDSRIDIRHIMNAGENSFRIVKDPRNDVLYYLKLNGDIYQVKLGPEGRASTSKRVYRSTDHKVDTAAGMAIGDDGTIYLTGNAVITNHTIATVTKGVIDANTGKRLWSVLAQTEPYPGLFFFNHQMNGIAISPDGGSLFVNIGARTEHGEVSDYDGLFPGLREVGLTTIILKLPASGENIFLPNDREALRAAGFLFAEGLRNTYDLAFAPNGDLFGTENGPDRDMPDELNWLREGHHYGFPWRMGTEDNPQRFPDYDPSKDPLLAKGPYSAHGLYHNDPSFPPPPTNFTDPVINVGPDADSFRDLVTGEIKDASDLGLSISTFTAHRSPLGLVFDRDSVLSPEFRGDGFVLSWTAGDPVGASETGPFKDASEDLLHLRLTKVGNNYEARVTRIAAGFSNPMDAEMIGNKIYVLEYGGNQGIWEIRMPSATVLTIQRPTSSAIQLKVTGVAGERFVLESSGNLADWEILATLTNSTGTVEYTDSTPPISQRFYRVKLLD